MNKNTNNRQMIHIGRTPRTKKAAEWFIPSLSQVLSPGVLVTYASDTEEAVWEVGRKECDV